MTQRERDQILNKLLEIVTVMQNDVSTLKKDVSTLKKDVSNLQKDVSNLQKDVSNLQKETRNLSKSIAVIEVEHGRSIQLLVDGQVSISEKLDSFENRFVSDEKELVNHSNRIWNLENHIGIA